MLFGELNLIILLFDELWRRSVAATITLRTPVSTTRCRYRVAQPIAGINMQKAIRVH
jgi:hypothetical protein